MKSIYTHNHRDLNESTIIDFYNSVQASVHQLLPGAGRDLDVAYRGKLYVVEVKRTKTSRLTVLEKTFKAWCERNNIPYNIVWDIKSAGQAIGVVIESVA